MLIFADKIYENPLETLIAFDSKTFEEAFSRLEILRKKYYLVGYIRYEAKDIFLGKKIKSDLPLLYFEVFQEEKVKRKKERESCNRKQWQSSDERIFNMKPKIDFQEYSVAIDKIKQEIAQGNTYEVNYTYDWQVDSDLEGFELFQALLHRQKTPYNAYIKNDYDEILSFSPELFFELENNRIRTKPMKGTVKRGQTQDEDEKNIEFLKNDEKNRAENVMIVDLLRNDLGRIAKTGTVKVDKLFEIETHKTLHQMTSEISAELDENITLFEIFESIFPCGSITGAPKISTMEIIEQVEQGERGVYCGAIGVISPEKTLFSVPIRILQGGKSKEGSENGNYTCRVGGAIVWDSTAEDEWEETLTKISFLRNNNSGRVLFPVDYKLVETMLVINGEIQDFEQHFGRLEKSAQELGFVFNKEKVKSKTQKESVRLQASDESAPSKEDAKILRLLLDKEGKIEAEIYPYNEIKTNKVIISQMSVKSSEKLLYHKTTYRPWYEKSMQKIKLGEIFDEIFFNERGELTEGARSNIIVQIDGEFFTPPVKCGILNGVMRQKLLNSASLCPSSQPSPSRGDGVSPELTANNCKKNESDCKSTSDFHHRPNPHAFEGMIGEGGVFGSQLREKVLYFDDLKKAQKVFCINSIRGVVEVEILPRPFGEMVGVRGVSQSQMRRNYDFNR